MELTTSILNRLDLLEREVRKLTVKPEYITVNQAQALLKTYGIDKTSQTIRNWGKAGKFKTLSTGKGKGYMIDRASLIEFVSK